MVYVLRVFRNPEIIAKYIDDAFSFLFFINCNNLILCLKKLMKIIIRDNLIDCDKDTKVV